MASEPDLLGETGEMCEPGGLASARLAEWHRDTASQYFRSGDLEHCEQHLRAQLQMLESQGDPAAVQAALVDLAEIVVARQRAEEGLDLFQRALGLADADRDAELRQRVGELAVESFTTATRRVQEGAPREGLRRYRLAALAFGVAGNDTSELRAWQLVAKFVPGLNATGGSALEDAQRAAELAARLDPGGVEEVDAARMVGVVLRERGRVSEALHRFEHALALVEPQAHPVTRARLLLEVARTHLRARDASAVIAAAGEAERLVGSGADEKILGHVLTLRAAAMQLQGALPANVTRVYEAALAAFRQCETGVLPLARTLNALGRYDEAVALLEPHYAQEIPMLVARYGLSQQSRQDRRPEDVEQELRDLVGVAQVVTPVSNLVVMLLGDLAEVQRASGRLDDAIDSLTEAIRLLEVLRSNEHSADAQSELFGEQQAPYHNLIDLLYERNGTGDREETSALVEQTKARALEVLMRQAAASPPVASTAQDEALLTRARELEARLAAGVDAPTATRIERELEIATNEIAQRFPPIRDDPDGNPAAFNKLVREHTLVLEYGIGPTRGFVWALRRGAFEMAPLGCSPAELSDLVDHAVAPYRTSRASSGRQRVARERLSRVLLDVIPRHIWDGITELVVVPDSTLLRLPFEMLTVLGQAEPIGACLDVCYLPSVMVGVGMCAAPPRRAAPQSFVGFAEPAGVDLPLPLSGREVSEVAAMIGGDARAHRAAAADKLTVHETASTARIVHFATHAVIDDRTPMESYLQLSAPSEALRTNRPYLDDRLRAREIIRWKLAADLVVCSACRSADGRWRAGEGVLGLTRAFLVAGARAVVASLWPVPDDRAYAFMQCFYRHYTSGMNVAASLHLARRDVRSEHPDPYDWAGFVVVGPAW